MTTVRVALPPHLRTLVGHGGGDIELDVAGATPTLSDVLDSLEDRYPELRGTIRLHGQGPRRPLMRFFAGGEDLSHHPVGSPLPDAVAEARETLVVVGAIAGG